ncbi:MAG: DUF4249 family protein, partial [Saprospiraceae bacterium]|nr:DUF4249 family protein [Saprospiraceae bacterium]
MSCTKKLDVPEYLNFTPALVINGTLSPQQGALIEVSILLDPQKSHVVEENFVKDAKVRILDASGKLLEELIFIPQKGYVSQDTDFENGKTYGVEVQYLDFPLATTQIEIPPAIADMEVSITEFDDENTTAMISLKYQEPLKIFGNDRALNRGARDYPDTESPEVSKYFCNYVNPLLYDNSCQQPSLG